ncbi:MAG: hypothetical protein QM487_15145 [Candidatus Marithrix sp.]
MHVFLPNKHTLHHPKQDYSDGIPPFEHLEVPDRINAVLQGIKAVTDLNLIIVNELAIDAVYNLHDRDYVDFLLAINKILKPEQEYIPSIFRNNLSQSPLLYRAGMYCREIGTPINKGSIEAALNSAAVAEQAANCLLTTGQDTIALCRPPGHHAGKKRYGGYCFFNNAYIAAKTLKQQCAVLDIDYHLGDGSIEFANAEIPYFSLHVDPWKNYPYLDTNIVLPTRYTDLITIPGGIKGESYINLFKTLLTKLTDFKYIIVSLGFDALATDHIQDEHVYLEPKDYYIIGQLLAQIPAKKLIVLEGGYDILNLPACARYFTSGFLHKHI